MPLQGSLLRGRERLRGDQTPPPHCTKLRSISVRYVPLGDHFGTSFFCSSAGTGGGYVPQFGGKIDAHNPEEVGSEFWSARSERLRTSLDAADVPPLGGIVRRLVGFCALNAVAGRSEHDDEEELLRWVTAASCLVALNSAAQARSIYDLRSMLALRVAVPTCASAQECRATVDCSRQ